MCKKFTRILLARQQYIGSDLNLNFKSKRKIMCAAETRYCMVFWNIWLRKIFKKKSRVPLKFKAVEKN
jgi:hypothetical protein